MSITEIVKFFQGNESTVTILTIAIIMSLVQISPLKIEPWSLIGKLFTKILKCLGSFVFSPITLEMKKLETKMDMSDTRFSEEVGKIKNNIEELKKETSEIRDDADRREALSTRISEEVGEIKNNINELKRETTEIRDDGERREAFSRRTRIVRFADEIRCNQTHSSDHYHAILIDITYYMNYCREHPEFKNDIANESIHLIHDRYQLHNRNQTFLEFTVQPHNNDTP